jgi:hypothetical protein
MKTYHFYTVVLISLLLVSSIVSAETKSQWLNENPCMIKVVLQIQKLMVFLQQLKKKN